MTKHAVRPRRLQTGFTLIEVLTALAVLSIALGALIAAASTSARNFAGLTERTLAHWTAMNLATEVRLAADWPPVGRSNGTAQQGGRGWSWTREVAGTEDPELRRIEIEVRPEVQGAQPSARLTLFRGPGRPAP